MTIDFRLLRSTTFWNSLVLLGLYVGFGWLGMPIPDELVMALGLGYAGKEAAGKLATRGKAPTPSG